MEHQTVTAPNAMLTVADLRAELNLTLAQLGERVGLSKSQMHEVERTGQASWKVALDLEKLSGGRVDAAALCEAVRESRAACAGGCGFEAVHGAEATPAAGGAATGQAGDLSGQVLA